MPSIYKATDWSGVVNSDLTHAKTTRENLSHSTIHWVAGENSRVVLRDAKVAASNRLIGHVAMLPGGRVRSTDRTGRVCTHKSAFHAVRALESRMPAEIAEKLSTHRVASKTYADARRDWNAKVRAEKAAKKAAKVAGNGEKAA